MKKITGIKTISGFIPVNNNISEVINEYFKEYRTPYSVARIVPTKNELLYTIELVDGQEILIYEYVEVLFSE